MGILRGMGIYPTIIFLIMIARKDMLNYSSRGVGWEYQAGNGGQGNGCKSGEDPPDLYGQGAKTCREGDNHISHDVDGDTDANT